MYRTKTEQQQARELVNALIADDASELSPLGRGLVSALLGEPARELRLRREVLVNAAMSRSVSYRVNGATKTWTLAERQVTAVMKAVDLINQRIDDLAICPTARLSASGKRERANLASRLSSQMREITFDEPDPEPATTAGQVELAERLISVARKLGAADGTEQPNVKYNAYDAEHEDEILEGVCGGAGVNADEVEVDLTYAVIDAYQDAYVTASRAAQGS